MQKGEEEARKRNFVLYVRGQDFETKVRWHPDGWTPIEG